MKKTKLKFNFRIILLALCTLLLSCAFLGYAMIGNRADALPGVPSGTTVDDPLFDFDKYCYSEQALDQLATQILGGGSRKFSDLVNYAKNTAGTAGLPMDATKKNITLKYGRYRFTPDSIYRDLVWLPVYLSRSSTGDAVLTLYLAATSTEISTSQQEFDTFSSYGTYSVHHSSAAPSNSYGSSAMRAVSLGNGGRYAYYPQTSSSSYNPYEATIEKGKCNKFSDFVEGTDFKGELYDDIVEPSKISWQARESYADNNYFPNSGNTYCLPNEAYESPSTGTYYYPGFFDYNETNKANYNVWKDDKVWLPSLTEVGTGDFDGNAADTTNGIWKLTKTQRSNTIKSWLRTAKTDEPKDGNPYSAYTMYCTDTDGAITKADVSEKTVAIRPAIHLNLSQIANKTIAPIRLPDVTSSEYTGEVQTIMSVPEDKRTWYNEDEMTITFFQEEECTHMVAPLDAGTYYMRVTLKNSNNYFYGEDKNVTRKVTKFVVEKAKIQVEFIYDEVETTVPIKAVIVDKENVIKDRDVQAGYDPKIGLKYNNIAGIALKDPYSFPDIKGTYEATAYIINDDIYNYNYQLSGNIKSTQFRVNERNIPEPYFIAEVLSGDEELSADKTQLKLYYQGKRYIQIANISKYVEIKVTDRTGNPATDIIECTLRDDGVMVYQVEDCADYTFTVSLVDPVNTQWEAGSADGTKDTIPKSLNLHISPAEITVKFNDNLPSSWENAREMEVELEISGIYEEIGDKLEMEVYYQSVGGSRQYLQKNSSGKYLIPSGLKVGTYTLAAVIGQGGEFTNNYYMKDAVTRKFELIATVAQFNNTDAVWTYKLNGNYPAQIPNYEFNEYDSASHPLELPYGGYYSFSLVMDEDTLKSKYLKAIYSGDTYVNSAGLHSVTVTITAYDKYVEFTEKKFTIWFKIAQTTFDLSGIKWNYTSPFTYNGNDHVVMLDPATPLPAGLTATYTTSGITTNAAANAGTYTTTVSFIVSDEYAQTYMVPVATDPDSYTDSTGTFTFSCTWVINAQTIEVQWTENTSTTNVFFVPTLQTGHSYVDYVYEKKNGSNWEACDKVTVPAGAAVDYRVKAVVKSVYSGNYELDTDAWHEFTVESGKKPVTIHFELNDEKCENGDQFAYTGSPFNAKPVVDAGDVVIEGFTVKYYSVSASGVRGSELPGAPVKVGRYVAVVSNLSFENAYLADSETEVEFEIIKADFDMSGLKWQYTHGGKTIYAKFDAQQKKWVDAQGAEVVFSFEYDGTEHKLELVGLDKIEGLTASNIYDDGYIPAGNYTSGVSFSFDSENYNNPSPDLFPSSIAWTVTKAKIHFENVKWGYYDKDVKPHEFDFENDSFVFTRDADGLVYYKVGLLNLPAAISDNLSYSSIDTQKVDAAAEPGRQSYAAVGKYETRVVKDINYSGDANNEAFIGELPASVPSFLNWEITSRELTQPEYDGSWHEFDDKVHDLIEMCGVPEEERYYYNVKVLFVDPAYNIYENYAGYENVPYAAYHSGVYTVRFYELQGEEETEFLKWQVEISPEKESLVVTWDLNGSIPVARVKGVYITDMLDTVYFNESGGEVTKAYVQSTDNVLFYAEPRVSEAYSKNLKYVMAEGEAQRISFRSSQYKSTSDSKKLSKPSLVADTKEYTGNPITFEIASWNALYAKYLYVTGDDLTQTEVGTYTVVINFKKEADAYWDGTDDNRNSIELKFYIQKPQNIAIDYPIFDLEEAEYSGGLLEFTITNWVILQNYITYELGDLTEVRPGVLGQTAAGVYPVVFKFRDGAQAYWKATNGQEEYTIELSITNPDGMDSVIKKPTLATTTAPWTGNVIGFKLNNESYYNQYVEVTSGSLLATNPGTYKVVLSIKQGLNVTFSDGTKSVELSYTITPPDDPNAAVKLEVPTLVSKTQQYTGAAIEFKINDWDNLKTFLEITEGSLTKTAVGKYSVTIAFKDGTKATWADGTRDPKKLDFEIVEKPAGDVTFIPIIGMVKDRQQYTGDNITFVITDFIDKYDKYLKIDKGFGYLVQSAVGEYTFYLQIKDKTTTKWENGTTDDIELKFYIDKAKVNTDDITVGDDGSFVIENEDNANVNIDDYIDYVYTDKDGNVVTKDDFVDGEEYKVNVTIKQDKLDEFNKNFENADELREMLESKSYTFVYRSSGGLNPLLIITISVVGVLVFLVVATIIVLAVKRRQYDEVEEYYDEGYDYEEDDE